jgi:hypothetical protein
VSILSRVVGLSSWFTSASVLPWAGVLAAVIAALTVDPKSWVKSPLKCTGRVLRVAAVWLVAVSLFQLVLPGTAGWGRGSGGTGSGAGGPGSGGGTGQSTDAPSTLVTEGAGPFPGGAPANVILIIEFVPSPANADVAQDFACDLLQRGPENRMKKVEIRAARMEDFNRELVRQLREVRPPADSEKPVVQVKQSPFPGENVLRRVRDKIRDVLPTVSVVSEK